MIASIVQALVGLRGVIRITHATLDSYTVIEYIDAETVHALASQSTVLLPRHGNESPTAKYMLLPTPEQQAKTYRKIMADAEADTERIREHGSWAGGWS